MQDEWGNCALTAAIIGGHVTTATLLIEKGANVEYQNKVKGIDINCLLHYNLGVKDCL